VSDTPRGRSPGGQYQGNYDLYAGQTPGQTLGPFFCQGLVRTRATFRAERLCRDDRDVLHNVLVTDQVPGERIRLEGTVYDGLERPIPDALVEIWQADAAGRYAHPLQLGERHLSPGGPGRADAAFQGFGRVATDDAGRYGFDTLRPGPVPGPGHSSQSPHINVILGARGMTRLAFTRIYFGDDLTLAADPVLARVPLGRRATLLAKAMTGTSVRSYVFDIHLQGEHETVFFDF
jgi:protocatechuate 3,4-dioxygenase alpha subunit